MSERRHVKSINNKVLLVETIGTKRYAFCSNLIGLGLEVQKTFIIFLGYKMRIISLLLPQGEVSCD
jgi:hypothetical protein